MSPTKYDPLIIGEEDRANRARQKKPVDPFWYVFAILIILLIIRGFLPW